MPTVIVLPENASAEVPPGTNLMKAGEKAGVHMEGGCFSCFCGTCMVEILEGADNLEQPAPEELDILDGWNKDSERFRLACCTKIKSGKVVLRHIDNEGSRHA